MTTHEKIKQNLKLRSDLDNWEKSISIALDVPDGFLPKLDEDGYMNLSLVREGDILFFSFAIIPEDSHPGYQTIFDKILSTLRSDEIIRELEITIVADVDTPVS
jgi:hypothetical protein